MTNPNDPEEVWKPVNGFERIYEVSTLGRVRSWYRGSSKLSEPKIKSPSISKRGYHLMVLGNPKTKFKAITLHRLVLSTFVSEMPSRIDGCHKNGIKSDNRLCNLMWAGRIENEYHKLQHGTLTEGVRNGQSKLNELQVRIIRRLDGVMSQYKIAAIFGVTQKNISAIKCGKSWNFRGRKLLL